MKTLIAIMAVLVIMGCDNSSPRNQKENPIQGEEGGACYPNKTCNEPYICLSDLCVNPNISDPDAETPITDSDNIATADKDINGNKTDIDMSDTEIQDEDTITYPANSWIAITAGQLHTCGIKSDNSLNCWGNNQFNQIGNGKGGKDTDKEKIPVKISDKKFKSVSSRYLHTCAISETNSLYCWGDARSGKLGTGESDNTQATPTKIGTDTWEMVSCGGSHTCGINKEKHIWCWGDNSNKALGDGTTDSKLVPQKINKTQWKYVSAGGYHTCSITLDNDLYCWGANYAGQLGTGDNVSYAEPKKISGEKWIQVETGEDYTCAISVDRTMYCWGENKYGQLGNNELYIHYTPTRVNDALWHTMAKAYSHTCAIKPDNRLFCWGKNDHGQIGDGTVAHYPDSQNPQITNPKYAPVRITDKEWSTVTTGENHTCAIDINRILFCWGGNEFGQLGDGTSGYQPEQNIADKYEPTPVIDEMLLTE